MPNDVNQTPEEGARDRIDARLRTAGWHVPDKEALRQSILKQAFSGHLVPQNRDDEPAANLLQRIKAKNRSQEPAGTKRKAPAA